jgi:hypothetical protein
MNDEPKTVEALMALPELPKYEKHFNAQTGVTEYRPRAHKVCATVWDDDSIVCVIDKDGNAWRPVKTSEGWFRAPM